ncbi:transmembrane protein 256 homolog [Mya arenaria]|uniref:transmembrane protein 256 homolog n=1 Tax=Mya arenaria TaxID=6604 RepID=UPI0022E65A3E|nr:transmembrane protein 256 homolog [Mya arenaria]
MYKMELVSDIFHVVSDVFVTRKDEVKLVEKVVKEIRTQIDVREMAGSNIVRLAGISGALAVSMAAYGAHAFNSPENDDEVRLRNVFESGNKMHLFHSAALMAVPLTRHPKLIGSAMFTGMVIFSGTCYYQAITKDSRIRFFTPYGGMLLIVSWLLMIL